MTLHYPEHEPDGYVHSPILFHQMIGRGTRIDEGTDKLMFRVFDYTGATTLFGKDFVSPPPPEPRPEPPPKPPKLPIKVKGVQIDVTGHLKTSHERSN